MNTLGLDIGFGFTKATDGKNNKIFKSVLGEAVDIQFRSNLSDNPNDDYINISLDDTAYFIGELAERQSTVRLFTLDQNQFINNFVKALSLTAIGSLVGSRIPINIITGLPVGYYKRFRDDLENILKDEHKITFIDIEDKEEEKVININKIKIVPQPFGSFFNLLFSDDGKLINPDLSKQKIGIIDIGFRTTDYTVANKLKYSERGSKTTDYGISKAFNVISSKLREKCGINVELYRLYEAVEQGSIKIRGVEYDISTLTDQVFTQLANAIANDIERTWVDDWDIDSIMLTGGGGPVLAKYLTPQIVGNVKILNKGSDARLNNVYGYFKYANHIWGKGGSEE